MKAILLSFLLFLPPLIRAQETTGEIPPTSKFETVTAAVDHYRERLSKTKTVSFQELYEAFGVPKSDQAGLAERDASSKDLIGQAGNLVKVDVCLAPKLGDTIQRVGYILVYEHNIAFADTWMVHGPKGWQIAQVNFTAEMEIDKTFAAIPTVYFNK